MVQAGKHWGMTTLSAFDLEGSTGRDGAGRHATAAFVRALRPQHWAKNALVFLPLVLAHEVLNPGLLMASLIAFVSFSLAASATYLINDIRDIETDRRHPTKRNRPFASGALSPQTGLIAAPVMMLAAIGLAFLLPQPGWFLAALASYLALGQFYVFYLKRKLLVDVLALATLHVLRILAGNAATGIALSSWLLAFAMFLFFSLALLKRYAELREAGDGIGLRKVGRGYQAGDLETLSQLGVGSALMTVVVVALYVNNEQVKKLYGYPELIWLVCPVVLYVLARIWVLARRGEVPDDPLVFLLQDWRSQLMGALTVAIVLAAAWL
jgi:4-hydroxybenzoate polyprenyltransferase